MRKGGKGGSSFDTGQAQEPDPAHAAADAAAADTQPRRARPYCRRRARRARTASLPDCAAVQYPPREVCRTCLSSRLVWRPHNGEGELIADTVLHAAQELYFRERLPWRIGMVSLDGGVNLVVYVHESCRAARHAAFASKPRSTAPARPCCSRCRQMGVPICPTDPKLREMTCDPRGRKILVTDGKSAVGQAVVRGLAAAGADMIWIGEAEPWKKIAGAAKLHDLPQATVVPLDVTDAARCANSRARSAAKSTFSSTPPIVIAH